MISFPPALREVHEELDAARKRLLNSVVSLSQEEMDFSPSAERWLIGENLDHLRLIEDSAVRVLRKLADKAEKAGCGPDPGAGSVIHSLDRFRIENVVEKIAAPASVAPTKGILLGRLDGYQWALSVAGHEERHRRQIENVKALRAGPS